MDEDRFRELFQQIVEKEGLDPAVAEQLLEKILFILFGDNPSLK